MAANTQSESERYPILVVEDDNTSRLRLVKTLQQNNYQVSSACNGREALELFEKQFFPLVLTDWEMPELSGIELTDRIRKRNHTSYTYIILLTSHDTKNDTVVGLESGADDYLTKPFDTSELLARLKTGVRILDLEYSLKQANDEITTLSITDPLTGTFNRGYLTKFLPKELERAKRYHQNLSLVMCDIDHFKDVNDTYGHQPGDAVLERVAECLNSNIRTGVDWVARYGGEEFIIVLAQTPINEALCTAERLRHYIANEAFETPKKKISVTASFGVTSYNPNHPNEESLESLIQQADEYLYLCKRQGRNLVLGS
ncbi:MAG: diguanylate cyclase response regulator [Gammaproteobacteria bacterium]|nr:MAG: diguanylate cyclase response regulator [Gammaproteobacteria bacterium]